VFTIIDTLNSECQDLFKLFFKVVAIINRNIFMSIEALWLVKFRDTNDTMRGNGVIVFETGWVFGGDSSIVYLGSYKIAHDILTLKVKLTQYAEVDGMSNMFGNEKEYEVTATGEYDDESKTQRLTGTAKGSNIELIVTAERYAELP
jgi:hypothetical protein